MKKFSHAICITFFILSGCDTGSSSSNQDVVKAYLEAGGTFHDMKTGQISFVDPASLQFTSWSKPFKDDENSIGGCVNINAKNSFGGYTGLKNYSYYIENNQVTAMFQSKCSK